ncbi:hypothetical protein Tco_0540399 [Tanacetum coccineum]
MTNKINNVLKAITDQITGTLPSDTVKNPKLGPIQSRLLVLTKKWTHNAQTQNLIAQYNSCPYIHPKQPEESQDNEPNEEHEEGNLRNTNSNPQPQSNPFASIATEQVRKLNSMLESLGLVPQSSNTKFVCSKEDDGEVMFIKIIRDDDEPHNEGPNKEEGATMEEPVVEYFDTFPTRDELTYHTIPLQP